MNRILYVEPGALGKIKKAFQTVQQAHSGQFRKGADRELFYYHPRRVCKAYLQFQNKTLDGALAALCHDLVEDTWVTLQDIEYWFGYQVRYLVDDLTKPEHVSHLDYLQRFEDWPLESKKIKVCDIEDNVLSSRTIPVELRRSMMIKWKRYLDALTPRPHDNSAALQEYVLKRDHVLAIFESESTAMIRTLPGSE